jgi:hypothetical protein
MPVSGVRRPPVRERSARTNASNEASRVKQSVAAKAAAAKAVAERAAAERAAAERAAAERAAAERASRDDVPEETSVPPRLDPPRLSPSPQPELSPSDINPIANLIPKGSLQHIPGGDCLFNALTVCLRDLCTVCRSGKEHGTNDNLCKWNTKLLRSVVAAAVQQTQVDEWIERKKAYPRSSEFAFVSLDDTVETMRQKVMNGRVFWGEEFSVATLEQYLNVRIMNWAQDLGAYQWTPRVDNFYPWAVLHIHWAGCHYTPNMIDGHCAWRMVTGLPDRIAKAIQKHNH